MIGLSQSIERIQDPFIIRSQNRLICDRGFKRRHRGFKRCDRGSKRRHRGFRRRDRGFKRRDRE